MTEPAVQLRLSGLAKSFGAFHALQGVDLQVRKGEFCALLGPSGCGKSTLLRLIAGLEEPTSGRIEIAGRDVTMEEPSARQIAMVFQSYALYPHMTVAENIAFSLEAQGVPRATRLARAAEVARLLQLDTLLMRKPAELSGGQRQRVAIGRALVRDPQVFLFDEPLSNLDAQLRVQMRIELSNLHRELGATMVYVTHDQVEAMTMADRIVVLRSGVIEQVGTPLELYRNPVNTFVAGFIGSPKMNLIGAVVGEAEAGGIRLSLGGDSHLVVPSRPELRPGIGVTVGLRPEAVGLDPAGTMPGEVDVVEHLGGETLAYVNLGVGPLVTAKLEATTGIAVGDRVRLKVLSGHPLIFDEAGASLEHA